MILLAVRQKKSYSAVKTLNMEVLFKERLDKNSLNDQSS